jgi:hypothetical protein
MHKRLFHPFLFEEKTFYRSAHDCRTWKHTTDSCSGLKDISLQARKIRKIGSEAADFSVGYCFLLPLSFQLRGSLLIRKVILPAQDEISINHDIIYYEISKV